MKYYVIINGESSLDIEGLAIESLPAISKPLMRSKREEIDGRDGDIITQLGFSAYDKTLKIGLWGNYDIDEIISYFNQDGIISFSNEPDMYYNFTILNRIDFINQLEAFRKATITIHCQPFKYKEEETETLEIEEHQEEGTNFNLEGTYEAPMQIDLKGNTNQVQLSGKNMLDDSLWQQNKIVNNTTGEITNSTNNAASEQYMAVQPNTTYTFSSALSCRSLRVGTYKSDKTFIERIASSNNVNTWTFTTDANTYYLRWNINYNDATITQDIIDSLQLQINSGNERGTYEKYCGGVPSPNPSYPQDIHNVSGNNNIVVCGKNLYIPTITNNGETIATGNCNVSVDDDEYTLTATAGDMWFTRAVASGTAYQDNQGVLYETNTATTLGFLVTNTTLNRNYFTFYDENKVSLGYTRIDSNTGSINVPNGAKYFIFRFGYYNSVSGTTYKTKVMVSYNEIPTTYEAYNGTTYTINLGDIELNKIGTYQDYFYKENDKWYLHKEIGKVVLNGSESWIYSTSNSVFYVDEWQDRLANSNDMISNYFKLVPTNTTYANMVNGDFRRDTGTQARSIFKNTAYTDLNSFKTWLSTNNVSVYYVLATPTNTEITDTTLIEQLEAIKSANSYYGTTNINQVNNDMPFILDVSYLSGTDNITITNHGNYYSKPKLTLTGTGNIGIYLNDSQIFQVALGTDETIIIDTDKMETYYESTLKNRQVIGDYNSFKLLSGENTIKISGTFSKLQVDNYSRWI